MEQINRNNGLEKHILLFGSTLIFKTSSIYQTIFVTERSTFEGKRGKFRMLQFSSDSIQGIMNLEQPHCLVASYSRITVDLIDHYASDFKNGFIIGHGIGTVSSHYSNKNMLTAEIDPVVVEVSKKYFGHTGKNVLVGDGQALLKTREANSQDIIFLDAYSGTDIPIHLTTKDFFTLTNEKLANNGILIMNYLGNLRNDKFLHTLHATISEIFPCVKVFSALPNKITKQNLLIVASQRILDDFKSQEATQIQI
ncbi:spermidine synthase [Neobacillus bataviensis]|uniref:spermidine synthase n=1 Tax=Neobacillus bataviensis TaxID=220685 RepID=UPI001CBB04B5|nr:fused MFS/spermidine synthase [Neobacillus bataviensis]